MTFIRVQTIAVEYLIDIDEIRWVELGVTAADEPILKLYMGVGSKGYLDSADEQMKGEFHSDCVSLFGKVATEIYNYLLEQKKVGASFREEIEEDDEALLSKV